MWGDAIGFFFSPSVWLYILAGHAVGLIVGVLPAIGPAFAVALMLPFTFGMDPALAVVFLVSVHAATAYGDSITSLLVNVPGGISTVATCWDGYPMTRQGKSATAIGIVTLSSWLGGMLSLIGLIVIAEVAARVAFLFGAPENFALGVLAITMVAVASKDDTLRGLVAAGIGLIISFVGADPVTGTGSRFAFGVRQLEDGIPIIVTTLGMFAVVAVAKMLEEGSTVARVERVQGSIVEGFRQVLRYPVTLLRGGLVGLWVGILPALGTSLAGVSAYIIEKNSSKHPETFGKGEPAGLVAPEVSKGACVVGDMIPTLTLGIPGSAATAILMGALIIHGIIIGPTFLQNGTLPYVIFVGIFLSQCLYVISGLALARFWTPILRIPMTFLAPIIAALSLMGAFMNRYEMMDMVLLVALGVFGYILDRLNYPLVCLLLGAILGPIIETNFHRSLAVGFGSATVFLQRPAALVMLFLAIVTVAWPFISSWIKRSPKKGVARPPAREATPAAAHLGTEFLFLGVVAAISVVMLVAGTQYTVAVRLFPSIVIPAMLLVMLVLGTRLWVSRRPLPSVSLEPTAE